MKKVLIITYSFPPRPGISSNRLGGLAKYLPKFGWEPTILTVPLPERPDLQLRIIQTPYQNLFSIIKKKLYLNPEKGFKEQTGLSRAIRGGKASFILNTVNFIKGIIAYPDQYKYWYSPATKAASNLLASEKINVLLSSSYPVTAHIIARNLKIKYNMPWVADLRDLWTQNHNYNYGFIRRWFERKLEMRTLIHANSLITVSKPLAEKLNSLHNKKLIHVITNGFDPEEMKEFPLTKEFTLTYTGRLYYGKHDPTLLFRTVRDLINIGIFNSNTLKVRFFGPFEYWLEKKIRKFGLERIVIQHGMVAREIALVKQRESQILLFFNWNDPREKGIYTGKLFEYLGAKRPILAIGGSKDVVSELLEETATGVHVSSLSYLKKILANWFTEYKKTGKVTYKGRSDKIQKYSHPEMARKFALVLEEAIKR